ncbi:MAG: FISUMP domain-containing protein [Flavicella sp.]
MKLILLSISFVLFLYSFGISQDLPSYIPTDGLVAYYPFNGNANDESGNAYHGVVNGATVSTDRFGNLSKSFFFKGESNITIPDSPGLNIFPLTISLWYKLNGLLGSSGNVISKYQPASWNGFQILYDYFDIVSNNRDTDADSIPDHVDIDYKPSANDADGDGIIDIADVDQTGGLDQNNDGVDDAFFTNFEKDGYGLAPWYVKDYNNRLIGYYGEDSFLQSNVTDDSWYHYVFVVNQNEGKIYVDSKLIDVHNWTGSSGASTNNNEIKIGGHYEISSESGFYGDIDDVGIWNRALTEQEIQNLYTSSTGDIILNGVVSAENNQIRNVADPTHTQDAVTLGLLLEKISSLQDQIDFIMNKDNQTDNDGDGYTEVEGDCNDTEASIRPLVFEVADGIDNNCDGNIDEGYNYTPVIDIDGNSYNYAAYGDQVWTVKSAEMVTYRDGTTIPQVTDTTEWANLTTGAWCYYDNDPNKGKLYNWYAVAGIHDNDENTPNKEFAPEGWHVPTDAEWRELENYLIANGYNYDGTTSGNKIAKSLASTTEWTSSTGIGTVGNNQSLNNSSGFNATPDGYIAFDESSESFYSYGEVSIFWSSTDINQKAGFTSISNNISDFVRSDDDVQACFDFNLDGSSFDNVENPTIGNNSIDMFTDLTQIAPPFSAVNSDGEVFAPNIEYPQYVETKVVDGVSVTIEHGQFLQLLQGNGNNNLSYWDEQTHTSTSPFDRVVVIENVSPNTTYDVSFAHRTGNIYFNEYQPGGLTLLQVQSMNTDYEDYQLFDPTPHPDWKKETYSFETDSETTQIAVLFSAYDPNADVSLHIDAIYFDYQGGCDFNDDSLVDKKYGFSVRFVRD